MKVTRNLSRILIGMGLILSLAGSVTAQDNDGTLPLVDPSATVSSATKARHFGIINSISGRLGQASRSLAAERSAASPDVLDPAFDIYANPTNIGMAFGRNDSAMLTDVALQLAEGERILLRSRNAISAKQAMELAIRAASQQQDADSLHRIAKFADLHGDKELAGQAAAALKLAAVSRDTTPQMIMVPVEDVDVEVYARIRHYNEQIERARLLGDARGLDALELDLDGCIPDPFRNAFRKRIGETKSGIPADHTADDQLIGTLSKLDAISRDGFGSGIVAPEPDPIDEEADPADVPVSVTGTF